MSVGAETGEPIISVQGLSKRYGRVVALTDVDLDVREGEIFGLLGPNGSGKTTTIRIVLGLLRASGGHASAFGFDCWSGSRQVRERVSFLPGEIRLIGHMTGYQSLKFLSSLRGGEPYDRAVHLAETVMELDLKRKVRAYSTGMKQKLALAQAFADRVELLILDEPTSALDPTARALVLDLVRQARQRGQTVMFSGHVLSEVEAVCDRVAIMNAGRLVHLEDMNRRRQHLRLILARFGDRGLGEIPDHLQLTIRRWESPTVALFEHRGPAQPLLEWLSRQDIVDLAIGVDDLRELYDRYHGTNADAGRVDLVDTRDGGGGVNSISWSAMG